MRRAVGPILAPAEKRDAARTDETTVQDVVVVRVDLRLASPFLQARFGAGELPRAVAEDRRRDAVEHRRLMELDERIRVEPVAACRVPTIDQRDVHVGVVDQRVREGHAHRAGADDEVLGFQCAHRRLRLREGDGTMLLHAGGLLGRVGPDRGQGVRTTLPGMCLVDLSMKAARASPSG